LKEFKREKNKGGIMECQNCGSETRSYGKFCHKCGTKLERVDKENGKKLEANDLDRLPKLETVDLEKGRNYTRTIFLLVVVFPILVTFTNLYFHLTSSLEILDFSSPLFWVNSLFPIVFIILFIFLYRGKQWAIYVIGITLLFSLLLEYGIVLFSYDASSLRLRGIVYGILVISVGYGFIKSNDVREFVKEKDKKENL